MTLPIGKIGSAAINAEIEAAKVLPTYTVAQLPSAAANTGKLIRVSNGNAGAPCLALSNGTAWLRIPLGVAVNATT